MQFGIGILGKGWSEEGQLAAVRANTAPVRPNFHLKAAHYAAKIAAETVLSESPSVPDLSDDGIVVQCSLCALPVRPSEAPLVRESFLRLYGQEVAA